MTQPKQKNTVYKEPKTTTRWTDNPLSLMETFPYKLLEYKGDLWITLADATDWQLGNTHYD